MLYMNYTIYCAKVQAIHRFGNQPTNISGTQHPVPAISAVIGCWGFDVGCWMFPGFMGLRKRELWATPSPQSLNARHKWLAGRRFQSERVPRLVSRCQPRIGRGRAGGRRAESGRGLSPGKVAPAAVSFWASRSLLDNAEPFPPVFPLHAASLQEPCNVKPREDDRLYRRVSLHIMGRCPDSGVTS